MVRPRNTRKRRVGDEDNDGNAETLEEGRTVYYPNVTDALKKPRLDSEWSSYATHVEREDKQGQKQTFVVNETPFTKLGFNMVRVLSLPNFILYMTGTANNVTITD
jgi:hypothetical protein